MKQLKGMLALGGAIALQVISGVALYSLGKKKGVDDFVEQFTEFTGTMTYVAKDGEELEFRSAEELGVSQ